MESEMNTIVPDTPPWRYRSPPLRRNMNHFLFRRVLVAPISDFESSGLDLVVSVKESETVVPETLISFEDSGTVETVLPFEDSTAVVPEMVLLFDDSDMVVPEMIPPCDESDTVVQEMKLPFDFSQSFLAIRQIFVHRFLKQVITGLKNRLCIIQRELSWNFWQYIGPGCSSHQNQLLPNMNNNGFQVLLVIHKQVIKGAEHIAGAEVIAGAKDVEGAENIAGAEHIAGTEMIAGAEHIKGAKVIEGAEDVEGTEEGHNNSSKDKVRRLHDLSRTGNRLEYDLYRGTGHQFSNASARGLRGFDHQGNRRFTGSAEAREDDGDIER
ncbi:hypothetical protein SASPL_111212 [Salvia splendens]|uniref:Uncharacterized protein n=1 Tax=Salvia splendens TaxID=180675 RepID=A0A8X9A3F0_SALSN|nr:hypothetical protein SASPL_111212 [Salvia splendens]